MSDTAIVRPERLPAQKQPEAEYLTSEPAAALAGVAARTIRSSLPPDAWYISAKADKRYPLWLPESVLAFRAERQGADR